MKRILVVIVSHGRKNDKYLYELVREYQSMSFQVDITILSNIRKKVPRNTKLVIVSQLKNPWSLPFKHKEIFTENVNNYEVFIYTEDDVLINERNIEKYIKINEILPENEVPGFLRYEIDENNRKYCSTIHSQFFWDIDSIKSINGYTFAFFNNEHSACFIVTQKQLKDSIKKGNFYIDPYEERYDMLCSAATDMYTRCGLKKMICISHIDNFLLHHLPNVYIGKMGLPYEELKIQIQSMLDSNYKKNIKFKLFDNPTTLLLSLWHKKYYENIVNEAIKIIPEDVKNILSIGCGDGRVEHELIKKGKNVFGIPLDSVIATVADKKGVKTLNPKIALEDQIDYKKDKIDLILFYNILRYFNDPIECINKYKNITYENSYILILEKNFNHLSVWRKRISSSPSFSDIRTAKSFENGGVKFVTKNVVKKWVKICGLKIIKVQYSDYFYTSSRKIDNFLDQFNMKINKLIGSDKNLISNYLKAITKLLGSLFGSKIIVIAKKYK